MEAPTNIKENKRFRVDVLQKCEKDLKLRAYVIEKCRRDKIFLINTFFWTFDPRLTDPHLPFILYPKQEKLIHKLDDCLERSRAGENISLLIDKSRDVGATFTLTSWGLCGWLLDDFSMRMGSRKEDYVDKKGEQDTLFYKVDYNLERLPKWLLPEHNRASMILSNDENGNIISGESANPNFGRGGRKTAILFDEHGFWEWAKSSWESSGEATNLRITMSTPPEAGKDSYFYKLRAGLKGKVEIFDFDWQDVPSRDAKWLANKKENKSEEEFAREVLKSYDGTIEGKVYARDIKLAKLSDVEYNNELPLFVSWDFGLDGFALIWWQKDFKTNKLYIIDSYWKNEELTEFFIPFVTGEVESGIHKYKDWELDKIKLHKDWARNVTHFGDPDVKKRDRNTGRSTRDYLEDRGIYVQCKDWAGRTWKDMREIAKMSFRRVEINETRNEELISALRNAKYPKRRENSQSTTAIQKPIHDWTSHFRTSYEYFCDNEPESDYSKGSSGGLGTKKPNYN